MMCEKLYSPTRQFPTCSLRGNKYGMVMVEIDSNAILLEPLKSRQDKELIRAYDLLVTRLRRAGINPRKHVLDNEISENMKNHIRDHYQFQLELVLPRCHRRNAAEVAIRSFKAHFLSILSGTADSFPPSLWDRLLPQTEITLNLLRQSNATPKVSALAHLCGPFDYNKMPLAPMGCEYLCTRKRKRITITAFRNGDYHNAFKQLEKQAHQALAVLEETSLTSQVQERMESIRWG
jgi:hypothetical protein